MAGTLPDAFSLGVSAVLMLGWAAVLLAVLRLVAESAAPIARSANPARTSEAAPR